MIGQCSPSRCRASTPPHPILYTNNICWNVCIILPFFQRKFHVDESVFFCSLSYVYVCFSYVWGNCEKVFLYKGLIWCCHCEGSIRSNFFLFYVHIVDVFYLKRKWVLLCLGLWWKSLILGEDGMGWGEHEILGGSFL